MVTVDQFVGWLFEADGVDPSEDLPNGKSTSMGFATRSYATWAAVPSMSNVWRGSTANAQTRTIEPPIASPDSGRIIWL